MNPWNDDPLRPRFEHDRRDPWRFFSRPGVVGGLLVVSLLAILVAGRGTEARTRGEGARAAAAVAATAVRFCRALAVPAQTE